MHIHDLILLVIESEEGNRLQGRTLLQKKLYFLSVLKQENLDFRPHYYGPYSREVSRNLGELVVIGFLKEMTETFPPTGPENVFGEIRRHTYSLTSDGKTEMAEIRKKREYASWQETIKLINSHPLTSDFNKLSIAAKIHYIVNARGSAMPEQIRKTAKGYGWNITDSDIDDVLSFLEHLSLVSLKEKVERPSPSRPQEAHRKDSH